MSTSQASTWHNTYIPSPAQDPLSYKSIGLIPLHHTLYPYPSGWPWTWDPSASASRISESIRPSLLIYLCIYLLITTTRNWCVCVCSSLASSHLSRLSFSNFICEAYSNFSMKDWCPQTHATYSIRVIRMLD